MAESLVLRMWRDRDKHGWRNFAVAMLVLSVALLVALFSAAVAQQGRVRLAAITTVIALGLAGWVAINIVPKLARRTSLRWIVYQVDYRLTRVGIVYLGVVFVVILACVNTGNNLLWMLLSCAIAGMLISGVLSRAVLRDVELRFDMPEHVFAEQPVVAELELRNEKQAWPSFSLRVVGENKKGAGEILTRPVFFLTFRGNPPRARKSSSLFRIAAIIARTPSASAPASPSASSRKPGRWIRRWKSSSIPKSRPLTIFTKFSRC